MFSLRVVFTFSLTFLMFTALSIPRLKRITPKSQSEMLHRLSFVQVSEEERNMMLPLTNFGIKCMSMGFLVKPEDSVVWRGPMVMGAIERMIHGTIW